MNTTAFSKIIVHLILNILLILCVLWGYDLLHMGFMSQTTEILIICLTTVNVLFLLLRLRKTLEYKQTFIKSFLIGLSVYVLSVIEFHYIAGYYHNITLYWSKSLYFYAYSGTQYFILALIIAILFQKLGKQKESNENLIDID